MSPAGALNCVKHTLPHIKFFDDDSRAQEHEGHALGTKTLRSHITRDYAVFNVLRQGQ